MSRKNGRKLDGWLLIDKPAGPSSADVVGKLRWAYKATKVGHGGTLDPAATGLLVLAFGEATKCLPLLEDAPKTYRFMVRFGAQTSTDDAEGSVIAASPNRPTTAEVAEALAQFRGMIRQVPPQVSAVKVDGQRAYDLARAGVEMELKARDLLVSRLDLVNRPDPDHVELEMTCGKGGYVRAIARDLALALGTLGHALWLRRLAVGAFDVGQAHDFAKLAEAADDAALLRLEAALDPAHAFAIDAVGADALSHGRAIPAPTGAIWASFAGQARAIGGVRDGLFHPSRVLNR